MGKAFQKISLIILRSFARAHKHLDYYSLLLSLFFLFLIFLSVVIKIKLFLFSLESVHFHELAIINGFVSFHPHKNANQVWVDQWDNLIYVSLSNPLELGQQDLKEIYLLGSSYLAWEACKKRGDFSLPSSLGGVKGMECNSESFPFFLLSCILRSHILWCLRNLEFLVAHISLLRLYIKVLLCEKTSWTFSPASPLQCFICVSSERSSKWKFIFSLPAHWSHFSLIPLNLQGFWIWWHLHISWLCS